MWNVPCTCVTCTGIFRHWVAPNSRGLTCYILIFIGSFVCQSCIVHLPLLRFCQFILFFLHFLLHLFFSDLNEPFLGRLSGLDLQQLQRIVLQNHELHLLHHVSPSHHTSVIKPHVKGTTPSVTITTTRVKVATPMLDSHSDFTTHPTSTHPASLNLLEICGNRCVTSNEAW